jgi:acylphosphatase
VKSRSTVIVRGRVQGVAFRHHTAVMAERHEVYGWVRNLGDGSVQACFEGEDEAVKEMVRWCRRGPDAARVDELVEQQERYTGEFTGFSIRHGHD